MSERNGDRARYQKARANRLRRRRKDRALVAGLSKPKVDTTAASLAMHDEGAPLRTGD
jgi:hypothetical protein